MINVFYFLRGIPHHQWECTAISVQVQPLKYIPFLLHNMASDKPIICAHLAGIEVVGDFTPEKDSNTQSDYFVVVYVDEKDVAESETKPGVPSPQWEWREDHRLWFQPSSTIKIMIYCKSSNLVTKHLVGQHTRKAIELLQNDTTLDLKDKTGTTIAPQIKIKLSPVSEPEFEGKSSEDSISSMQEASIIASPSAAKLLRILTMLPAGIIVDDLATMTSNIGNIDEINDMLTDMSLASLTVRQGERIVLSPLKAHILDYQQLDDDCRRDVYSYHFKLAEEGLRNPGDPLFTSAMQKLIENQRNIESALMDALENGCIPAIEATLQYSSPRCAIKPRIDILEKAVVVTMAEEASKPEIISQQDGTMALTARCLQRLGEMKIDAGIYKTRHVPDMNLKMDYFAQAMKRFEKLGDSNAIAYCQIYVAKRIWINAPDKGIQHLEKTRDDFIAMGDLAGAAKCELRLGDFYLNSRQPDADAAFQRALAQSNGAYHTALCNQLLSSIYIRVGRLDDARSLLDIALNTLQKFGDRAAVAKCLKSMAILHIRSKRRDDACAVLRQVITELTWLGRDLDAAFAKWQLGGMCDDEEAVKLYQEAIPQFHASLFVFADAECRWDLGCRYLRMGRFSDALLHLEIARRQLVLNETHDIATRCLLHVIQAMYSSGNTEGAKLMLKEKTTEIRDYLIKHERLGKIQEKDLKLTVEIEDGKFKFCLTKPSDLDVAQESPDDSVE